MTSSTRRDLPFYRSRLTRYAFIVAGLFLAYSVSVFAPAPWHETPSLRWLHTVVPFWVMTGACLLYVALLVINRLGGVVFADYLGLTIYSLAFISALVTLRFDRPTNPFLIAATFLAAVLHYQAGRLAVIQQAFEPAREAA